MPLTLFFSFFALTLTSNLNLTSTLTLISALTSYLTLTSTLTLIFALTLSYVLTLTFTTSLPFLPLTLTTAFEIFSLECIKKAHTTTQATLRMIL